MVMIEKEAQRACVAFVKKEFGSVAELLKAFNWIIDVRCCTNARCTTAAAHEYELLRAKNALAEVVAGYIPFKDAIYNECRRMKALAESIEFNADVAIKTEIPGAHIYGRKFKRLAAVLIADNRHHLKRLIKETVHN